MSEYALRDGSSIDSPPDFKQRINTALAQFAKNPAAAFNKAKQAGRDYALIGTGIQVFMVQSGRVADKMIERDFLGRVPLDPMLQLNVAPKDISYAPGVLESGIFGASSNGELTAPDFGLTAGSEKVDLCDIFLACAGGVSELQMLPAVTAHGGRLGRLNLKAYVALAGHIPNGHSPRPYAAELVLAVCRDNAEEPALFNLGDEWLFPSHYRGRGSSPKGKPMAGKVLHIKAV